jgi:hypothetical protein
MKFSRAVRKTPALREALRPGLRALKPIDRTRLGCVRSGLLTGSVDVDAALAVHYPNDPRWDYAVGWKQPSQRREMVSWIEVHPATTGGTVEVLRKLDWLQRWLSGYAPMLQQLPREFVWIASGKVAPNLTASIGPILAKRGVRFGGRRYMIGRGRVTG